MARPHQSKPRIPPEYFTAHEEKHMTASVAQSPPRVEMFPDAAYFVTDVETTGLDRDTDDILQIAWMLLNADFVPINKPHSFGSYFVKTDKPHMSWTAKEFHDKTGFSKQYDDALVSGKNIVDVKTMDVVLSNIVKQGCIVVGNQVESFDLAFFRRLLPETVKLFSHNIINVSSVRDLYAQARGISRYRIKDSFGFNHSAWGDVCACHKELLFYRNLFLDVTKFAK